MKQLWYIRFHKKVTCTIWRTNTERLSCPFGKKEEKSIKHSEISYLNNWKWWFKVQQLWAVFYRSSYDFYPRVTAKLFNVYLQFVM